MIVPVFDLDDTLYNEMTFVQSGFRAVARFLQEAQAVPEADILAFMLEELTLHGRGKVFDQVLMRYKIHSKRMVAACIQVYRAHEPDIALYEDAVRAIERLAEYPIYIVTDGNKHVQAAKLKALGLYDNPRIRKCYITRRYGIHNEKPSPYCFQHICRLEGAMPEQVVYFGDNPHKDFVGIKPLGFRTVRVMRGAHAHINKSDEFEAELRLNSLDEFDALSFFNL